MRSGYFGYILNANNIIDIISTEHNDPKEISLGIHLENKSTVHLSNTLPRNSCIWKYSWGIIQF